MGMIRGRCPRSGEGCLSSDRCETGLLPLERDRGSRKLGVSTPQLQEIPDEGFWPSRSNLPRRLAGVSPDGEDLSHRSRQARRLARCGAPARDGLTAEKAARPSGLAEQPSTAGRSGSSRAARPHRRQPKWTSALMRKLERLRLDHPMWGKPKIASSGAGGLRRLGLDRRPHPQELMARASSRPCRRSGADPADAASAGPAERHARRLPKGLKPTRPGELVQVDTLFVNVAPTRPSSTSPPTTRSPSGPSASSPAAPPPLRRSPPRQAPRRGALPGQRHPGRWRVGVQGRLRAGLPRTSDLRLFVLPPKRPQLNGHVERAQGSWRYEFYGVEDLPSRLKPLQLRIDAFAHRYNPASQHPSVYVIEEKRFC